MNRRLKAIDKRLPNSQISRRDVIKARLAREITIGRHGIRVRDV
jgi:hypothetical protein